MTDETKSVFRAEFERIIAEFELPGHPGETDEEQGLAVLNLLRDLTRLRMKYFPEERIPVHDDRKFAEWLGNWMDPDPELATFEAILNRIGRDPSSSIAYLTSKVELESQRQSERGQKERPGSQDPFFHIIRDYIEENPDATQDAVVQYLKDSDDIIIANGEYRHVPTGKEVMETALKDRIYRAKKRLNSSSR